MGHKVLVFDLDITISDNVHDYAPSILESAQELVERYDEIVGMQ